MGGAWRVPGPRYRARITHSKSVGAAEEQGLAAVLGCTPSRSPSIGTFRELSACSRCSRMLAPQAFTREKVTEGNLSCFPPLKRTLKTKGAETQP